MISGSRALLAQTSKDLGLSSAQGIWGLPLSGRRLSIKGRTLAYVQRSWQALNGRLTLDIYGVWEPLFLAVASSLGGDLGERKQ